VSVGLQGSYILTPNPDLLANRRPSRLFSYFSYFSYSASLGSLSAVSTELSSVCFYITMGIPSFICIEIFSQNTINYPYTSLILAVQPTMGYASPGVFIYYEDEEDVASEGLLGKVVDAVNTGKDIAYLIWNAGWSRKS
jgi:hypothetical protein